MSAMSPMTLFRLPSRPGAGKACHAALRRLVMAICLLMAAAAPLQAAQEAAAEAPLVVNNRTLHVFRASLGAFTPQERAEGARQRIEKAFEEDGAGWTSVKSTPHGMLVLLDDKPLFNVIAGDARELAGETPEALANQASRILQKAWTESRERREPGAVLRGVLHVLAAMLLLALVLAAIIRASTWARGAVAAHLEQRLGALPEMHVGSRLATLLPRFASRFVLLAAWLLSLLALFLSLTFSLAQFVVTRPASEGLTGSLRDLLVQSLNGVAAAVPGTFVAALIFIAAWVATQVSNEVFAHVGNRRMRVGMLNAHTAPATRRITNASLWLFAVAMAYPYLPGAHTEAFKGLSVILGIMVSIGASGLVGQIASGLMLVYTHALQVGEYVRIQECEGTVTELGLFVTRLRTGTGEEIALPNALVLSNVTRNFSRAAAGGSFVLDTCVTIGYDTPWRQVHALLVEAALALPEVMRDPAPYVVQTALNDFYVTYKLVAYVTAERPAARARVLSAVNEAIQDAFNRHGVQIMSPHYIDDPAQPKVVPPAQWHAPPAAPAVPTVPTVPAMPEVPVVPR